MLALVAVAVPPVVGQPCLGDCDSSGTVTVDELIVGLNVALGVSELNDCTAFERVTDGTVTVDELVEGVRNALRGCGMSSTAVKASSSVALSSIFVMDFGSLAGGRSAAAAQSLALANGPTPPAPVGGGTGFSCDTLFCPFGGTEVRCCDFGALTFEWSQCVLADGTEVNGSYFVESNDEDPCFFSLPSQASAALAPPTGIHFLTEFTNYSAAAGDFFGNFAVFVADLVEEFQPFGAECSLIFPDEPLLDPLGFAIRGDGTRYLQGSVRTIAGNGPVILQDVDTTFGGSSDGFGSEVTVDVIIDEFSAESCLVDTEIDGVFSSTNLLTGRQFTETYDQFLVLERADFDGSFLIDLDGTSTTDCLGTVEVSTREPLKIFPDRPCPAGGELTIVNQQAASTVFYEVSGGVDFDFDSDGQIDETSANCLDLGSNECGVQRAQGECTLCAEPSDCGSGLVCAACVFCEKSVDVTRCAPQDDFATCLDGLYGELFIEFVPR
jgi:hypothetical protein